MKGHPHATVPHYSVLPRSSRDFYRAPLVLDVIGEHGHPSSPSTSGSIPTSTTSSSDDSVEDGDEVDPIIEEEAFATLMEAHYGPREHIDVDDDSIGGHDIPDPRDMGTPPHAPQPNEPSPLHTEEEYNALEKDARTPLFPSGSNSRFVCAPPKAIYMLKVI